MDSDSLKQKETLIVKAYEYDIETEEYPEISTLGTTNGKAKFIEQLHLLIDDFFKDYFESMDFTVGVLKDGVVDRITITGVPKFEYADNVQDWKEQIAYNIESKGIPEQSQFAELSETIIIKLTPVNFDEGLF